MFQINGNVNQNKSVNIGNMSARISLDPTSNNSNQSTLKFSASVLAK